MPNYNIAEIYSQMEKELTESMFRNLMRHTKEEAELGIQYEQWQAAKLRQMRQWRKHNAQIIGKHTKNLPADIKQHLENEYKQGLTGEIQKHKELFGNTAITADLSEGFFAMYDGKVKALIDAVNNDLAAANFAALRKANDAYRQTIHRAAMFAANGVTTEQKAIEMAVADFAKQGLTCIVYANGAKHNIKEYAQMAVRTAEARAMLIGEGRARQELGETLIQITKHGTACELCVPFEGKVLIDDVYSAGTWDNSKEKYEQVPQAQRASVRLMSEAMAKGLYHPRCRHGVGTWYAELWGTDAHKAPPPKAPEKTAEEIAAEQAAAKQAAEAAKQAAKESKWKELYKLNNLDSLTPADMQRINDLEDDLMASGDYDGFDEWAAKKTAQTEADYNSVYALDKKVKGGDVLTADEQKAYNEAMQRIKADDIRTEQENLDKFKAWAVQKEKLELEAKLEKIKHDTEALYDALYHGKTGADVDALKQAVLDDQEMLDAYNALTEPLYDAAKDELKVKRDALKAAKDALTQAEDAEKVAKKVAKDAKDAAAQAAADAQTGWMPNFDKEYFAKFGRYPDHTDIDYNAAKNRWRAAKYTYGKTGADLDAAIDKLNDFDVPNYEVKRMRLEQEAQDKAAELAKRKAEKKAAKQAADAAQAEADAARDELERAKQSMLKLIDDSYSQERKDAAYWFAGDRFGGTDKAKREADNLLRPIAGEKWRNMSATARKGFYEYTAGSGKFNRPLRGYDGTWSNYKGVGKVPLDNEDRNVPAMIKAMKDAYNDCTYDFDIWVQRGDDWGGAASRLGVTPTQLRNATDADLKAMIDAGLTVKDEGFISTGTAKGEGFPGGVITNIYCPKGTRMLYVEPISAYGGHGGVKWDGKSGLGGYLGHEFETLLDAGQSYRLIKAERRNGMLYLDMEVVLDGI